MLTLKTEFFLFFTFLSNFITLFSFCFSSFYALNKTPLEETRCLTNPYVFIGCSSIQFFNSRLFCKTVNQFTFNTLPLTVQHLGNLWNTMPLHYMLCHQLRPTPLLPRQAEVFPGGEKYPKHVPLLTYLVYSSPKGITW